MKKLLFCAGLIALSGTLQTTSAQNDPKAKSVLEAASKKINSLKSLKANFALTLSGGKGGKVTDTKKKDP